MSVPAPLLAELAQAPARINDAFMQVPSALQRWQPADWDGFPGERFHALGQLCHLVDIETLGYHLRIARMRDEDHPDLASLDGYALAHANGYDQAVASEALAAFAAARAATLEVIRALDDEALRRRGTFAEHGELTLLSLLHYLASHDAQHLACLHWLLGRMPRKP